MPKVDVILPLTRFETAVKNKWLTAQRHPNAPYVIYNYSKKCQYENKWNRITSNARGLIVNYETGEIIARPFPKFFNFDEKRVRIPKSGTISVSEKLDGSLAILYQLPDGSYAMATRGSFTGPQALHATELYQKKYLSFMPNPNWTYLFEVIYPSNRIVLDYGEMDNLVLLAAIDKTSGKSVPFKEASKNWLGPEVEFLNFKSLEEIATSPPLKNKEGYVINFIDKDLRVKFKFEEYKKIAKLLSGLNEKKIWELLSSNLDVDEFLQIVPDEFQTWGKKVAQELSEKYQRVEQQAMIEFRANKSLSRKEFAMRAQNSAVRPMLFGLYDGQDISKMIWRQIEPEGRVQPAIISTEGLS